MTALFTSIDFIQNRIQGVPIIDRQLLTTYSTSKIMKICKNVIVVSQFLTKIQPFKVFKILIKIVNICKTALVGILKFGM